MFRIGELLPSYSLIFPTYFLHIPFIFLHVSSYLLHIFLIFLHISFICLQDLGPKGGGEGDRFKGRGSQILMFTPEVELGIFPSPTEAYDQSEFPTEACDWSEFPKTCDSVTS